MNPHFELLDRAWCELEVLGRRFVFVGGPANRLGPPKTSISSSKLLAIPNMLNSKRNCVPSVLSRTS